MIGCTFLIPPGHLLTTSTTRSRRPHRVLSSSPHPPGPGKSRLQGLTQLWLDQNSIGDAGARPRRRRCCPGAKVFSPATEARAPAPMSRRFLKAPMFIKLPLLRGSSEDSAKSEDHDATSQKRNAKENQYVDTKEPMKAFHSFSAWLPFSSACLN